MLFGKKHKICPPASNKIEFMERDMGGWRSRRRRGHAGTLPEHSAHLLCISVPIQTFNMLK